MSDHSPPRRLERILERALPAGLSGQGTLGDLAEEYGRRAEGALHRARLWYGLQVVSIVLHGAIARRRRSGVPRRRAFDLRSEARWALRAMLKRPTFSLAVIGVLGLGLGANVAVFSVIDGTLRNSSWWASPDATVAIWPEHRFSYGQLDLYRQEQTVYRTLGGYVELAYALQTPDGESVSVNGVALTPALFGELAAQPMLGRGLTDGDDDFGVEPVVVIGESLWRRSFAADPAIVGSRITVSGEAVTVVGVQAAGGRGPGGLAELWLPLVVDPRDDDFWRARSYTLVGVLADGATLPMAFDDLMAFTDLLSEMFPMFYPRGYAVGEATVAPADEAQRRLIATPLELLFAGTGLLMLVTAFNVGNLLLGRAVDRRAELGVRVSLGASRASIIRQLLAEGMVLTVPALALGLAGGALGGRWIARLFVEQAAVARSSVLSPEVATFALTVAVLSWLVVNGVPIAHFVRSQGRGPAIRADSGAAMQRTLVAVQAALATLLLVSATLLVATVENLRQVPLGFDPAGVLAVELSTPADKVASVATARDLFDRLTAGVGVLPGVESVGLTGWLPLRAQAPTTPINLESAPVEQREAPQVPMHMVDPGFFEVFGVEPLEGRLLGVDERAPEDYPKMNGTEPGPSAVVVNRTLARMLWPQGGAVGQRVAIDPHAWNTWVPVVGVVPDIRHGEIDGPGAPALYVALAESPSRDVTLVVRAAGDPLALAPAIGRTVRGIDSLVPMRSAASMRDVVRGAYSTAWVMMGLLLLLAGLATGLGAIGIYAVLAHHVARNKREIGVRMALGAGPGAVTRGVVRAGIALALIGIGVGSAAALMTTRLLESLLFGVTALEPWAFFVPALALAVVAGAAAWVPAARAGRLPPADVLRGE